jgi:DNA-binding winged helix-turn-helix (wHTH) protein/TolB-like protein/Tfp pilus assembly protein PilF
MNSPALTSYRFEDFRLDAGRRLLFKAGEAVSLPPKAFDILLFLVESGGEVVEKETLMRHVWQDSFVEDNNLTVNMTLVRKALGEKRGENRFIITVPGRGYRFAAAVSLEEPEAVAEKVLEVAQVATPVVPAKRKSLRPKLLVAALSFLLLIIPGWFLLLRRGVSDVAAADGQVKTLAVLPFRPLAPSEQDAILGIGMADALITKLSGIRKVTVRPTSAIAKYAAGNTDLLAAGRELGVDAVLDGKIQRSGDALRISVQLVRVSDNLPLWAGTFDTKETDIFTLQDSISAQVADSLALRLNDEERRRIARHSTDDPEAYKLYLNGIFQLNKRTIESVERAISYFNQAIQKQPDYAPAYAGLGDSYVMLGNQEALLGAQAPADNIVKAKAALEKALSLDESLADAHATMAWISIWETGDITTSQQNLRRALELNPDLGSAHNYSALLKMSKGQFDEALIEMRKALAIDQFSLVYNLNIGTVLFRARRYDEAAAQCRKTLELDQNFARAYWLLGLIEEARGNYAEAVAQLRRSVELSGGGTLARASLAHALAKSGSRAEAEKLLNELVAGSGQRYIAPDYIAMIYTALGDRDKAFEYLEKGLADRTFSMFQLAIEQRFDEIRNDPRFIEIESRVKERKAS